MERNGNSVNSGSYLGAATVRTYVMGQTPGTPDAAQLDEMRTIVRNAMEDGAFGISSALIYPPGILRDDDGADRDGEGDGAVSGEVHHAHALGRRLAVRGDG